MLIKTVRHLLAFMRPYPLVLPGVAVLGTIAALAEGVSIGLMIPFLATMMNDGPSGGGLVGRVVWDYAGLFPDDLRLAAVSATVVVLVVASCAISYGYIRLLSWAATRITHDLRLRLFEHLFETDDMFVAAGSQGRLIKAIDGGSYRAGQAVISLCLLVASACTALVFAVLLVLISWKLTALVLLGVAVAGLIVRLIVKRAMAVSRRFEARSAVLSESVIQIVSGLRMVRVFGQERRERDRFAAEVEEVRHAEVRLESLRRAMGPLIDGLTVPVLIAALVLAFYNGVTAAILLPFLLLVFRLQRYVREMDQSQVLLAAEAGAILEIAILIAPPARPSQFSRGGKSFDGFRKAIEFDAVSFIHDGLGDQRAPSLNTVSLTIERGETLGIVGTSGSGKSTLINLLIGLYTPSSGDIRIDGVSLSEIDISQWRLHIGFSGQDAELRSGTVAENIAYSDPNAAADTIRNAAKQANILDFIEGLPDGFETQVGARGLELSGGERQRIALARALLRKPEILILDEATNAVDNTSEAAIRGTLEQLKGSMTMIVIAHRLSSIRHADRIIVMDGGRIVEAGTPQDLLRSEGAFARLSSLETEQASKAS